MKINTTVSTGGDGFWSLVKKKVKLTELLLAYTSSDKKFGELRVFFTKDSWDIQDDGLIYSDNAFERSFRRYLESLGFTFDASQEVTGSEQGMQGDDYVSFDVGEKFIKEWVNLSTK